MFCCIVSTCNHYIRVSHLLQALNDNCRSTSTTVADACASDLALLLPQNTEKCGCDPGTRGTERVAKRNSASVEVDLVLTDVEQLHVGQCDNGEGLVDLEGVDGALLDTSVLERLGDSKSGGGGELGGVVRSVSPAEDLSDGLQVVLLKGSLGNEDKRGSAVRERRGIRGSDSAILGLERRSESACLGLVELDGLVNVPFHSED